MASSLGYAMMNWTSEFARHAKAKRTKKKNSKNKENCDDKIINNTASIHHKDSKHKISKIGDSKDFECNEVEIQTDDLGCERCEEYAGNVEFLEQQLNDAHITQETLKQKLAKNKIYISNDDRKRIQN